MKTVTIYSSTTCPHCVHAKDFFKQNNLEYTELDVSDPKNRQEVVDRSGQLGVPVIFIDEDMVIGFDEAKLRTLLSL